MAPDIPWVRAAAARFLAKIGRREEADFTLRELQQNRPREYVDAFHLALLLHALDRPEEALQELERARREGSYMLGLLDLDPKPTLFERTLASGIFANTPELGVWLN